jgi:hypothetical protein
MTRLLLAVAAIAIVGVGCGAAENDPNLAAAVEKTEAAGSSLSASTSRATTGAPRGTR